MVADAAPYNASSLRFHVPAAGARSHGLRAVVCAPAPMPLQPSDIQRIARLARLHLQEAEQLQMLEQINAFFTQVVEPMRSVDTQDVEPLAHPLQLLQDMPLRLREDVAREPALREAALANAPAAQEGLFIVPRVVE